MISSHSTHSKDIKSPITIGKFKCQFSTCKKLSEFSNDWTMKYHIKYDHQFDFDFEKSIEEIWNIFGDQLILENEPFSCSKCAKTFIDAVF